MFRLAVIGPQDLVERSCLVAKDLKSIDLVKLPYESETQAGELVAIHEGGMDGFLFTGFLPYFRVQSERVTKKPLYYYPIQGESLYRTLLMIKLHNNIDVTRVSIDTLTREQIYEAYQEIDLDCASVMINDRPLDEFSFEQYLEYHKSAYRKGLAEGAITAVNSVHVRLLEEGVPAFKVVPTLNTMRRTFGIIEAAGLTLAAEAAQIVVLIVSAQGLGPDAAMLSRLEKQQKKLDLHAYLIGFAQKYRASLFEGASDDDEFILFISKGMFGEYINDYANKPLAADFNKAISSNVNVGIGMGRSAWEAEDNARGALLLAKSKLGCAVYMMSQDKEITGPIRHGSECAQVDYSLKSDDSHILQLADRTGLSVSTLTHIQGLIRGLRRDTVTASELGSSMGVSKRTASRMLLKLLNSGVAVSVGIEQPLPRGRPRNLYRISL